MTTNVDQMGLDLGDGIGVLLRRFYPLFMAAAYEDAGAALALDLAFDVTNPRIAEVLADLAQQVRGVAETTRDEIRRLVGLQTQEGWSLGQLADAIRQAGAIRSAARAELIARTESAAAYSRGSLAAYAASGVVSEVEWLTAPSDACPICQPLNGQRAPLGETWGAIAHPPAHPGCRCAVAPVVN